MDNKFKRLQEIMSKALKLRRELDLIDLTTLAGEAADIYSLAKEELETQSMIADLEAGIEAENKKEAALPDWCKVGEWVYQKMIKEYIQIGNLDMAHRAMLEDDIKNGATVQARKRPFNEKETKNMIGKVLRGDKFDYCALITYTEANMIETQHHTYTPDELIDAYTIDGKPCYKLEHFENGEWVE